MSESILWNEMGNLHMRLGSYEDAATAFGMAIELSPDFSKAYSNLGHAYFSKGDYEGAIPLLQKSIDLSASAQEQSIAWKRLGDAYQKRGDYEKALSAYKTGDELDALADIGLINPFANLAVNVTPDPIILEDPDVNLQDTAELNNPEISEMEIETPSDEEINDPKFESDLPVIPPFYPALDIPSEEFQAPEPVKLERIVTDPDPVDESDNLMKMDNEEEYGEFNNWLKSLDRKSTKTTSGGHSTDHPGEQSVPPHPTRIVRVNTGTNPTPAGSYAMLDSGPSSLGIPLFTDQDLWGTADHRDQPVAATGTSLIPEALSTQVLEVEQPSRSSELFKSWQLSEQPEHDPNIWKSMLEALEKGQSSTQPEELPLVTAPDETKNLAEPESAPAKKNTTSRELLDGIANYRKITSMASLNDKAWDSLGKLLKDAGDFDEAVDAFQHAITICPGKDLYHYHLGLVFAAQKRHEDAICAFKKVVEINPGYTLAHCALAGSYRRLGLETEANSHIKAALPRLDAETEYNRACFEAICGNTDQAIDLLEQALVLKQTSPEWVRGDPDLDFIREDPRFQALVGM